MGSRWDYAISQAMQRHGGSNRSLPKAAQQKPAADPSPERSDAERPSPDADEVLPSLVPDRR